MAEYKQWTLDEVKSAVSDLDTIEDKINNMPVEELASFYKAAHTDDSQPADGLDGIDSFMENAADKFIREIENKDLSMLSLDELEAYSTLIGGLRSSAGDVRELQAKINDRREELQKTSNENAAGTRENQPADSVLNSRPFYNYENIDIDDSNSPVNKNNALEVAQQDLGSLSPSQLYALKRALDTREDGETVAAAERLNSFVLGKAKDYNNGTTVLADMGETYAFADLVHAVSASYQAPDAQEDRQALEQAFARAGVSIEAFEQNYGIGNPLPADQVRKNFETLAAMPGDEEIFALDTKPEKLQAPSDIRQVEALLGNEQSVPGISELAGALQCKELNGEQKEKLLNLALQRLKTNAELRQSDFANYEFLINALKESNLPDAAATAAGQAQKLQQARKSYLEAAPLKNREFQDIHNILNNIQVKGELKNFGRDNVPQQGADSDLSMFKEQVRRETEMYLANTSAQITPEIFAREYASRLRDNLVLLTYADDISKGNVSEKDFQDKFNSLASAAQGKHGIAVNRDSLLGWQAAKAQNLETASKRLTQRNGYKNVLTAFSAKVKETDQKLARKYGKAYSMLRGGMKSAGWGAAYSIAASFGPAGVAAVATASFANQAYGMYKDYKKAREQAAAENKNLNFWNYLKQNKLRAAGMMMGAATVAITAGGFGTNSAVQIAKAGSGIALAATGAVHQAAQAYKATQGPRHKKLWAATKAMGTSAAGFAIGIIAGKSAGEYFAGQAAAMPVNMPADIPAADTAPVIDSTAENALSDIPGRSDLFSEYGHNPDNDIQVPYAYPDSLIDVNNLSAEQQHDLKMLFLRDPREANAILQNEGDGWMNSRQLQEAWDNGSISDAQKAELVKFAGQRFDEHGNFVGQDAAQMEAEAKTQTDAHQQEAAQAAREAAQNNVMPESNINPDGTLKPLMSGRQPSLDIEPTFYNPEQNSANGQTPGEENGLKISKIKIDDNGNVKIVGRDEDGKRFVHYTDDAAALGLDKESGIDKVKFTDKTVIVRRETDNTRFAIEQDGEYRRFSNNETVFKPDQIQAVNEHDIVIEANKEFYQQLSDVRDKTADFVARETAEAAAPVTEAPARETEAPAPEKETPAAEAAAPVTEAPARETEAPAPEKETPAAEAAAPVTEAPAKETEAPAPEKETPAAEAKPEVHSIKGVPVKYTFDEDGFRISASVPTQVHKLWPETYTKDEDGFYHVGTSKSKVLHVAQELEVNKLQRVNLHNYVYNDLQARQEAGETLGQQEQTFMRRHEQNMADHKLVQNENGSLRRMTQEEIIASKRGLDNEHPQSRNTENDGLSAKMARRNRGRD